MSDMSVTGAARARHFSPEDDEMLRKNESTNVIVKRDTKTTVDVHGRDANQIETKERQSRHVGTAGKIDIAKAGIEGLDFVGAAESLHAAGVIAFKTAIAADLVLTVGSPIATLMLGMHTLAEAHIQGEEQNGALIRENVHVATVCALTLPDDYKAKRLDADYKSVPREENSPATKMTEALLKDPRGLAVLQLHCDQGVNAARDLLASHKDVATFLNENPKVADAYVKDAAFHEGFDAYLSTKDRKGVDQQLESRDGWYAQSHVSIRV